MEETKIPHTPDIISSCFMSVSVQVSEFTIHAGNLYSRSSWFNFQGNIIPCNFPKVKLILASYDFVDVKHVRFLTLERIMITTSFPFTTIDENKLFWTVNKSYVFALMFEKCPSSPRYCQLHKT